MKQGKILRIDKSGKDTIAIKQEGYATTTEYWQVITDVEKEVYSTIWCSIVRDSLNAMTHVATYSRMPTLNEWKSTIGQLKIGCKAKNAPVDIVDEFEKEVRWYWEMKLDALKSSVRAVKKELVDTEKQIQAIKVDLGSK